MSNDSIHEGNCPEPEVLSAYFDKELDLSSPEAKHIESCEFCQRHLVVYKQLSDRARNELSGCVPEGLADRIIVGVRKEIAQPDPQTIPFPAFGKIMKIAAAVVVCGGLSLYFVGKTVMPKAEPNENIQRDQLRNFAAHSVSNDTYSPNSNAGAISLSDMEAVSFGAKPESMAQATSEGAARMRPVVIPNRVRHVWVAHNLDKVKADINKFVTDNKIPANKVVVRDDRGRDVKVNMRLTKHQLVSLVKSCAGSGLELVSPQAPQPEENKFVGNANAPVQYNADFVLEDVKK